MKHVSLGNRIFFYKKIYLFIHNLLRIIAQFNPLFSPIPMCNFNRDKSKNCSWEWLNIYLFNVHLSFTLSTRILCSLSIILHHSTHSYYKSDAKFNYNGYEFVCIDDQWRDERCLTQYFPFNYLKIMAHDMVRSSERVKVTSSQDNVKSWW